ncbi:MAG: hypothetical protein GKR94_26470 [Gammaproteobacteria bacterium]|nr:hypothetical protein [Gammaproteobacteria bacterium]
MNSGFEAFFRTRIEPPIRLPQGMGSPSPRVHAFTIASILCLLLGVGLWLLDTALPLAGLSVVAAAGLILVALQLRMGGHSMGLHEARDHVVGSVAVFLDLTLRPEFAIEDLQTLLRPAGRIEPNSIMRLADAMAGRVGRLAFTSVQVLGAVPPARSESSWLGLPLERVTGRYTVDGLLVRFDLPVSTGVCFTVSNDRRLAHPDEPDSAALNLIAPGCGLPSFDEEFRIVGEASRPPYRLSSGGAPAGVLLPEVRLPESVCITLLEIAADVGPTTLHINEDQAYLSVWAVGDIYEISSLGSGLRAECQRVAAIMATPAKLARVLLQAYEMA